MDKLAVRHTSKFTMAVDFSDFDRDGDADFFLIDMLARGHQRRMRQMGTDGPTPATVGEFDDRPQAKRNTLHLNRGDLTFAEIGQFSRVQASEWTWSIRFIDVDLDGYEDLLATNGQLHDFEDTDTNERVQRLSTLGYDYRKMTPLYPEYLTPNVAFRNRGDLTFEDVSAKWGFTEPDIAWGMAFADFDNDGDLDVATNRLYKAAGIYRNETSAPRIAVRLKDLAPNTQAIGAKSRVIAGSALQSKEIICAGGYLSGSDPLAVFAANDAVSLTIEVAWRSGKISRIEQVAPNRIYEIDASRVQAVERTKPDSVQVSPPYFEDVSDLLGHRHHEDIFDDFRRQPALPYRLSQPGPGVAWCDLDNDGDDDLIIAGGKGDSPAYFRNDEQKGFSKIQNARLAGRLKSDQTAVLAFAKRQDGASVLFAFSNDEQLRPGAAVFTRHDFQNGSPARPVTVNSGESMIGPMAAADYDGDGDSDLILALEWGPVKTFRNDKGVFNDVTGAVGMDRFTGRWHGVTTGDFDEDGDQDIIATNWGLNTAYQASADRPLRLYYGDFDNNGTLDMIEAHYDSAMDKIVPDLGLDFLSKAIPAVRGWTSTHKRFAVAGAGEIIGKPLEKFAELSANTLTHTVFFNRGNHFEAVAMPNEAQFAPAFHVSVADFDGDGHDDIFLSHNFFAMQDETQRQDAGRGLWLRGDGTGKLTAVFVRPNFRRQGVWPAKRRCCE